MKTVITWAISLTLISSMLCIFFTSCGFSDASDCSYFSGHTIASDGSAVYYLDGWSLKIVDAVSGETDTVPLIKYEGTAAPSQLYPDGGKLYFISRGGGSSLHSINTDGSGEMAADISLHPNLNNMFIRNGVIYYSVHGGNMLYSQKLSGGEESLLAEDFPSDRALAGLGEKSILYVSTADGVLKRLDFTKGSAQELDIQGIVRNPVEYNGSIYYIGDGAAYKDGEPIIEGAENLWYIFGGKLYFSYNQYSGGEAGLFSYDMETGETADVYPQRIVSAQAAGGWCLICGEDGQYKIIEL